MNNTNFSISEELKTKSGRITYLTIGMLVIIFSIFRFTDILEKVNLAKYSNAIVVGLFLMGLTVIAIWGNRDMKYWRRLALGIVFAIFMYVLVAAN